MMKLLLTLLSGILLSLTVGATTPDPAISKLKRPVTGYYNLEFGTRKNLATYLSPFSYFGTNIAASGLWTKCLPANPEHLAMTFEGRANFGSLLNPSKTAREIDFHANVLWALEWQKRFNHNFIIGVGGNTGIYGGVMYLPRNGNNPVEAQFALGLGISASAGWHTELKGLPLLFTDRINIPLAGGFFCQQYGETYYEIYLGNHKNLAHFGWWGNRFGFDNLLSVTIDFGRTAMQLGYRISMQEQYASHLVTRTLNNAFVIGIIPGGIGLKQKNQDIITPLY